MCCKIDLGLPTIPHRASVALTLVVLLACRPHLGSVCCSVPRSLLELTGPHARQYAARSMLQLDVDIACTDETIRAPLAACSPAHALQHLSLAPYSSM